MTTAEYLHSLNSRFRLGIATEHTFRGDLQNLLESLVPDISATNEPKRQACGAPDYILTNKKEIPIGYIEAKDIGDSDLTGSKKNGNKEQFDRYKASLDNLIFTDYLNFYYYRSGELATQICIGVVDNGKILSLPHNFPAFELLLREFTTHIGQTIKSSKKLAEMMAGKARMLANVIENSLNSDVENQENSTLKDQMNTFKEILIHDITPKEFSDVYAQTIAYGMFAARLYDESLDSFSRKEAAELIPKSNPFLRKLFQYIAGYDLDYRITWIVDALADIFRATDVNAILKNFGKATKMEDPIIHFYEDFLSSYDPKLRKARGVWYTPHPVVNFIIRAVDDILIEEFGLPMGLADTSKTTIKVPIPTHDKRFAGGMLEVEQEVHRVQFLDPATGTGTFVAEAINQIYSKFKGQQGLWNSYVENHLLPRINGFELLMASYAMAHLKLDLLLKETGYKPTNSPPSGGARGGQRFRIYLTNSLEEYHKDTGTLFANWLSAEANEANQIKRDAPVMIVAGNPPYSGESSNKGEWIMKLMEDYKKEPGGKEKLKERNPKWINDDYVKFIRYGQHFIEKNGSGILAFINPHGFLDNPTFRGMRWNLLKTFDKIYTIDLHGNSKKKETAEDGSPDENVFDIMQGVSINIFIKNTNNGDLSKLFHYDIFGKRNDKYHFLKENSLKSIDFKEISDFSSDYFFVLKDFEMSHKYDRFFQINDLIKVQSMGITSGSDKEYIDFLKTSLNERYSNDKIKPISYRPFDSRYINYDPAKLARSRELFMNNFFINNVGISLIRRSRSGQVIKPVLVNNIADKCISSTLDNANIFPLYLYPDSDSQLSLDSKVTRTPNLDMKIVKQIADGLGLSFVPEKRDGFVPRHDGRGDFAPIDLLDYIYAVLHSPTYREMYKEFLKIDFPRVPYPDDVEKFWKLVQLGEELRALHLMESPSLNEYITEYPVGGDNEVEKPVFVIARDSSLREEDTSLRAERSNLNEDETASAKSLAVTETSTRGRNTGDVIANDEGVKQSDPNEQTASTAEADLSVTDPSSRGRNDRSDLHDNETASAKSLAVTDPSSRAKRSDLLLTGRVYINTDQYFDHVPEVAWNFYIGGYQPAQKWLKDRKGRTLEFEDILHYQKIIKALVETERIMREIDGVNIASYE